MNNDDNNITHRNKPSRTNSFTDLSDMITNNSEKTILDATMMSIPDSFHDTTDETRELTNEIKSLKQQLLSAHQEIDNLNIENLRLKADLQNMITTANTYKKICSTPERKSIASTRLSKASRQVNSPNDLNTRRESLIPDYATKKQNKGTQTDNSRNQTPHKAGGSSPSVPPTNPVIPKTVMSNPKRKNKLYILSSNKYNRSLSSIEDVFSEYFDYCHYIMPNSTIKQLLSGIEERLKSFTINDYCLIFIGENHIITNENNYIDIINLINKSLSKITHTNVVVCLPTYKMGSLIYNFKVEMFNNLLHLDNQCHKYAYIFDSNRDLTLDMFSYTTGRINKYGMKNIYDNIMSNIQIDFDLYCKTNRLTNNNSRKECDENLTTSTDDELNSSLNENPNFFRV